MAAIVKQYKEMGRHR